MKILVIDGHTNFREPFCEFLHSCFPLISIKGSDEKSAMQTVRSFSPDMVIMDTGLEMVRDLRLNEPGLAITLMVPYNMPEYVNAAYLSGADHIFSKHSAAFPEINRLLGIIRAAAEGRGGRYAVDAVNKPGKAGASAEA